MNDRKEDLLCGTKEKLLKHLLGVAEIQVLKKVL